MALAAWTAPKANAPNGTRLVSEGSVVVQSPDPLAKNADTCLHTLPMGAQLRLRFYKTILTPTKLVIDNPSSNHSQIDIVVSQKTTTHYLTSKHLFLRRKFGR